MFDPLTEMKLMKEEGLALGNSLTPGAMLRELHRREEEWEHYEVQRLEQEAREAANSARPHILTFLTWREVEDAAIEDNLRSLKSPYAPGEIVRCRVPGLVRDLVTSEEYAEYQAWRAVEEERWQAKLQRQREEAQARAYRFRRDYGYWSHDSPPRR